MRRLILGTAGHIDHGKTALVKALTGVDTDRLKEEKERGITVDLGFAEFRPGDEVHFGVVDVPGHEGFIRNMLAGATGMDLVLLVVAADEGVMPQTREHLAIIRLLGVPRVVAALTKADLVDPDWLELVKDEVEELLLDTAYAGAPILPVSAVTGQGLPELTSALAAEGLKARARGSDDEIRLPVDRVFTIRGTGTVVTGTLWSGSLKVGDRVRILPGDREARVRGIQLHGEDAGEAQAGARVALGLTGSGISHQELQRGQTLVEAKGWDASWMLTCQLYVLPGTGWELEQGQRVRVHLGTAEVLARVALLDGERLVGGEEGWVQLRLEEPLLARVRDHLVVRSYSPVTTLGGGRVAEVAPRKRRSLAPGEADLLAGRLSETPREGLEALLIMAGWMGVPMEKLPQVTGFSPKEVEAALDDLETGEGSAQVESRIFSRAIWREAQERILSALGGFHEEEPLRSGMPLEELRQVLPGPMGPKLGEAIIQELASGGSIRLGKGRAALSGFRVALSQAQEGLRARLRKRLEDSGLTPPTLRELEAEFAGGRELGGILRVMEEEGEILTLEDDLSFPAQALFDAGTAVVKALGGAEELGPAEFREVLDLSRKHLLPILRYFDTVGITTRRAEQRTVAREVPKGWGTSPAGRQ